MAVILWVLGVVAGLCLSMAAGPNSDHLNDTSPFEVVGVTQNDKCVCNVYSDWTMVSQHRNLQDMLRRMSRAEHTLDVMNMTEIGQTLDNIHERLDALETTINSQSVDTSVTELFDLRKRVESLRKLLPETGEASKVEDQVKELKDEMKSLEKVVLSMWQRNPYQREADLESQIDSLHDRFSRCQPRSRAAFAGDSLPITDNFGEWCASHVLEGIGEPTTHHWIPGSVKGAWFKDPLPRSPDQRSQIWTSTGLFQNFSTYKDFINNERSSSARHSQNPRSFGSQLSQASFGGRARTAQYNRATGILRIRSTGLGSVLYRGAIYYHYQSMLYKYNVTSKVYVSVNIGYQSSNYLGSNTNTYLDLKVDEDGLWLLYVISSDYRLAISRLHPNTLVTLNTWITGKKKTEVCAAFMICGKLYTVDECTERSPVVGEDGGQYTFDTHTGIGGNNVSSHMTSLYGHIWQVTYNARERLLFAWDNGHAVTYPLKWSRVDKGQTGSP